MRSEVYSMLLPWLEQLSSMNRQAYHFCTSCLCNLAEMDLYWLTLDCEHWPQVEMIAAGPQASWARMIVQSASSSVGLLPRELGRYGPAILLKTSPFLSLSIKTNCSMQERIAAILLLLSLSRVREQSSAAGCIIVSTHPLNYLVVYLLEWRFGTAPFANFVLKVCWGKRSFMDKWIVSLLGQHNSFEIKFICKDVNTYLNFQRHAKSRPFHNTIQWHQHRDQSVDCNMFVVGAGC